VAEAFLNLAREDQIEALGVAASGSGLSPQILEKDIWVVWTLNALFSGPEREHLVFKGGTSLSKAYGVIDRFSEDLDVTVDIRHLIPDLAGDADQPIAATASQQRRWRKAIDEALSGWIADVIVPSLERQVQGANLTVRIERTGDKVWIRHDPVSTGWGYMSPDVLIEFGGRSTGLPAEIMPITCYAASELPALTFPTAEPRVMRIERTFWEKATAVHVFCKADTLTAERLARHWYDLVRLDDTGHATSALADRNIARQVAAHKTAFFAAKGVDYAAAVAGDLQLVPSGTLTNLLRADYRAMLDNGLLNDQAPSFEELMDRSQALQDRANAIGH
jgi:hypothetical protein